mgnify:CR=1 FL=1
MNKDKVLNVVKYVKKSKTSYNGSHKDIGYHSLIIDNIYYKGQRDCLKRLNYCKQYYDFDNKNVLDIGCCVGGMLFPLSDTIKFGCGIDINCKNINAGNMMKQYTKTDNLSFYVFDLDNESLDFLKNYISDIDVVFLFSVCMWIKKWRELIDFISLNSKIMFIETNGSADQQQQQIEYCKKKFKSVVNIYKESLDDDKQHRRQLFVCKNKI